MGVNSQADQNRLTVVYVDMGKYLADFQTHADTREAALWAMGDLAASLDRALHSSVGMRRQFARQGISMAKFAEKVGLTMGALAALKVTAESFGAKERHSGLSFEHHQVLARLTPGESASARRKWLRDAAKQGWTPGQLARRIRPGGGAPLEVSLEERVHSLRRELAAAEAELAMRSREGLEGAPRRRRK